MLETKSLESYDPAILQALLDEIDYRDARDELSKYAPYPKQREFHEASLAHRERLFMAGNQLGKSRAGAAEVAFHLTGRYPNAGEVFYPETLPNGKPHPRAGQDAWPDGWRGKRFEKAIHAWVAGETQETTRDTIQLHLMGPPAEHDLWGTGLIPAETIVGKPSMQGGTPDAIDTVLVRHVSGKNSTLSFKSYGRGRAKWQAATLHLAWFDEEPPHDVYSEGMTRTNVHGGLVLVTFTPLNGMTEVVRSFLESVES